MVRGERQAEEVAVAASVPSPFAPGTSAAAASGTVPAAVSVASGHVPTLQA